MTGTRIYQGWRYTFDQARPPKERWQATRGSELIKAQSEPAIKKLIDNGHEAVSRQYVGMTTALA